MLGEFQRMRIRHYSWADFDEAVRKTPRPVAKSLCPIPRGGLVYAVALSHKFGIPIVERPRKDSVFIDEIADSGRTLLEWRIKYGNAPAHVLIRRETLSPIGINAIEVAPEGEWIVFPWESKEKAQEDYDAYIARQ